MSQLVRYIVDDVAEAITFYTGSLGFSVVMNPAPQFAIIARGDLRLALSSPSGRASGGLAMADGRSPEPGGWNRFVIGVDDLDAEVAGLRASGTTFRKEIVNGVGGRQILLDDPSGNPVELFEQTARPTGQ